MPKRNRRRSRKRRGGNPIAASLANAKSAAHERMKKTQRQAKAKYEETKQQVTTAAQNVKTKGEQAIADNINKAAAQIRPEPEPTVVANAAEVNILQPAHDAIKAGADTVRKATAGTSAAAHVPAAEQKARAAVNDVVATHKPHLLRAAQHQHKERMAAMKTQSKFDKVPPPAGLVAPRHHGGGKKRQRGLLGSVAHLGADFTGDVARGTGAMVGVVPVVGKYGEEALDFTGRAGSSVLDFAGRTGDRAAGLLTSPFRRLLGKSRKKQRHSRHRRHKTRHRRRRRRHGRKTHHRRRRRRRKTRHRRRHRR